MSKIVKKVTDNSFESNILKSKLPTLIDFWAPWCGPCKIVIPIFKKIALEYKNLINFMKLNVDKNKKFVKMFNIKTIPTLIFFNNGKIRSKRIGIFSESELIFFISDNFFK